MLPLLMLLLLVSTGALAAPLRDAELQAYFAARVAAISSNGLAEYRTRADWEAARPRLRRELFEMLSLDPLPPKSDLKATVTGGAEREDFRVENIHFQSMPGLYVTGNLYLPKKIEQPLPTILYVCGHGPVKTNGISYGNKVHYQHHGAWFARNGYACLVIDTLQLGEIEGLHHGTYREDMWWWNSRGYTPAGVEAWNSMRALDYLETRPEVDNSRLGVTGRSGGGAYSWWLAALDDRIKVAAPVAGITDLENHVVDGVIDGHCDCMFFVNGYRWDFPLVAALVAPRPLLIGNTDKDTIFPLDGVVRVHREVAAIYRLYQAEKQLGLLITAGPHADTQDLQVPVFRWFNRFLKQDDGAVEKVATRYFRAEDLKVFAKLPADERNTKIQETFPGAAPEPARAACSVEALRAKVFRAWPTGRRIPEQVEKSSPRPGWRMDRWRFETEPHAPVELHLWSPEGQASRLMLRVLNQADWPAYRAMLGGETSGALESLIGQQGDTAIAFFFPRGVGPVAWQEDEKRVTQVRRRFMLIGETVDSARVYDIVQALELLSGIPRLAGFLIEGFARGDAAMNLLLAAVLAPEKVQALDLGDLARDWKNAPDYLGIQKCCEPAELLGLLPARLRSQP